MQHGPAGCFTQVGLSWHSYLLGRLHLLCRFGAGFHSLLLWGAGLLLWHRKDTSRGHSPPWESFINPHLCQPLPVGWGVMSINLWSEGAISIWNPTLLQCASDLLWSLAWVLPWWLSPGCKVGRMCATGQAHVILVSQAYHNSLGFHHGEASPNPLTACVNGSNRGDPAAGKLHVIVIYGHYILLSTTRWLLPLALQYIWGSRIKHVIQILICPSSPIFYTLTGMRSF